MSTQQAPDPRARMAAPHPSGAGAIPGRGTAAAAPARQGTAALSPERLSALLAAGFGLTRIEHGRAALPAGSCADVDVYALLPEGCYRYVPRERRLLLVTPADLRHALGGHGGPAAPLDLLYVVGEPPAADDAWEECGVVPGPDAACLSRNICACCGRAGLACTPIERVPRRLGSALGLAPGQRIALAQRMAVPPPGAQ